MNKKIKAKWLRALRSGKFKQGQQTLCAKTDDDYEFCCIGVLAHIAISAPWAQFGYEHTFEGNGENTTTLSSKILRRVGLKDDIQTKLIVMNDNGKSFKQIANWIERNL